MWQIQGLLLKLWTSFSPSVFDPWLVESQMQSLWLWRSVCARACVCVRVHACVCARAHLCSCLCHQHPQRRSLSSWLRCLGEAASGVVCRGQDLALKVKKVATVLGLRNFPPPFGHQWGWCRPCCSFSEPETRCLGHLGPWPLLACEALLDSLVPYSVWSAFRDCALNSRVCLEGSLHGLTIFSLLK